MTDKKTISLPLDALPDISELTGDLLLLAEIIGVEAALQVAQVFGGTALRISKSDRWLRRWRNKKIRQEYDQKTGVTALARRYHLTERQVYTILGQADSPANSRQMKLW